MAEAPEMDADKEPAPAGGTSKSHDTAAAAPRELDDFGLPLRRFPTPPTPEAVADGTIERPHGLEGAGDAEPVPDDTTDVEEKPTLPPAGADQVSRPAGKGDSDGDSDSDDQRFEDAQSLPADATSPKKPAGEKMSTTPKPSEKPTSAPEEKSSDVLEAAEDPEADGGPVKQPSQEVDARPSKSNDENEPASPSESEGKQSKAEHSRDISITSQADAAGVSEYSHQHVSSKEETPTDGDSGWQEMPAYARYDMYDDDDRLIARERDEEEEEDKDADGLGGAGRGYTRVIMDEDAQSATSMDDHTQYLFQGVNGTSLAGEDEEARDAVSQMQATKDLLTEGQRIAYVGVVRLEIAALVKDAEELLTTKRTKKEAAIAAESIKMWAQKMMIRVYSHMDISEAEQIMIEQLAEHGVVAGDLTPALLVNSRVHNPMAGDENSTPQAPDTSSPPPYPAEEKAAEAPPPYEKNEGEEMPEVKTPSQLPSTEKIDIDLRWTVLCDLFLVLIADSIYDARSRVLLERVGKSMDVSWLDICKFEKRVTDALEMQQAAEKENWNEDQHMENRRKMALKKKYMMMGLATVGGGLVIGLSAGLLAPVIGAGLAAGFTTIGVTGTSSFLAGAGGAAVITSSAVASGSFMGGKAANRRMGAVRTFEYRPLHNNKRVNLVVTVSGWLTGKVDDVRLPFSTVDSIVGDMYSVLWEPEMLRSMGDTINILATEALTQGLQQVLGSTILISLMAALQLPIVLSKLSYLIDNPWAVSLDRATSAGLILADSLLERNLGTRPITLVGYSLGARVIFSCLKELAKKGAYGVVQNVYLFGSPVVVKKEEYIRVRTVVSGRFVNGYNRNDWILGYLFRLTNGGIRRIAGLAAIEGCPFVENMDVTDIVPGHMEYRTAMPMLLRECGWPVESEEFTEIEDPDPENHKERQRELINEIEEARRELEREGKASKGGNKFSLFGRRKKMEKQVWEVYEDSGGTATEGGHPGEEQNENRNTGVLFDIDAIRAELAKEVPEGEGEELQIREIQSTLPPMRLEIPPQASPSPSTATPTSLRPASLQESRSAETVSIREAAGSRLSRTHSQEPSGSPAGPSRQVSAEEITMAFDDAPRDRLEPTPPPPPPKEAAPGWLETKTAQPLPNVKLADPWGDPEDEDFGEEKEISMTFA